MRSLKRHGGEADNSGDDMDVSFDCEFNLSANLNQIPLKKLLLELSGKKLCRMSMMHS